MSENIHPRVGVITPTTGKPSLRRAIESVIAQDCQSIRHYVVVDGKQRLPAALQSIGDLIDHVELIVLPEATGEDNYFGHRIYASIPLIVNTEFVAYLDDDNWYAPNHLSSLIEFVDAKRLDWAYSLRKVFDNAGNFICDDNCDSLGVWGSMADFQNHIDTSCYFLKRDLAVAVSKIWYRKGYDEYIVDPDRAVCRWLLNNNNNGFTTGKYTLNYALGSSGMSVEADYMRRGNATAASIYKRFPWLETEWRKHWAPREQRELTIREPAESVNLEVEVAAHA